MLYRALKYTPWTERYVVNIRTVGKRRVMAGLGMGCLPLAVETGRYIPTFHTRKGSVGGATGGRRRARLIL